SEVTDYSVITDTARGIKYPLHGEKFRPPTAILDPGLVASAPQQVTAATGMDVLTHAIEAYVSKNASDFTDALAEKAITLCMKFLPLAYKNGNDLLAREKMHNASCLAGLAFNTSGLGLNHSIAHAVGAKLHIPHGKINAMLLPFVIDFNADLSGGGDVSVTARKFQRIAKISDLSAPNVIVGVGALRRTIANMNGLMQIPATLRENGTDLALFDSLRNEIVEAALNDVCTRTNPRDVKAGDVEAILRLVRG
ncbi:MAG: iron-containing alcohol dehydrogenase, partial [Oscillospiraceae bacterium]